VARLVVEIGRDYGMRAVRLPAEPRAPLRRAFPGEPLPLPPPGFAVAALRRRLHRAGLACNDHVFGVAWSGAMTEDRILALLPHLPEGASEIYFHPAAETTPALQEAMSGYRPTEELAALVSPRVRCRIEELGIRRIGFADLAATR
jgi:chitin disaccharide deacetylase